MSGNATPGATVTISKNGVKVGETTAGNDGTFTVDIDKQDPNTTLTLTPSKNGVNGTPVTATVTGETPAGKPTAPAVEPQNDGSVDVTPAAGTDSLEITYTPEGETSEKTITVKKDKDGNWTGQTPDGVTVDKTNGKVTIPANKIKDGSKVTAKNSKNGTNSDNATGQTGTNDGNSGSGTGSETGSGSETGNSNGPESDSGNDSTSNNGGSDSGSTTGGSSFTDSGAQNSTNESSSADNANNASNAETGNAGNASTGASGSNASTKFGNKVPAKHSSQLVNTGAEVERVGLISAMIGVLGAAAAFFSRKKNRE